MDKSKRASFVSMSRQKFAKGGHVKKLRKNFDSGGPTTLGGPTTSGTNASNSNPNTGILGTIGGALGLNNNFVAQGANIQAGTNAAQLNNAYTGVQDALGQQANLTNTLAPQATSAVQNQNALAQQLYGMTQGEGPNPAKAELAQATQQNVANQNALMAGQRGASGNVGLMARQAAQQGANTQQQAVGQAATLQAQQQIAAQQNLANLAGNQIGQSAGAVQGLNTAQQNEQNTLQNANTATNNANVGMQSNINNANAQTAAGNQGVFGKVLGGVSSAISSLFAEGGAVEKEHHVKLAEMNAASLMHGRQNFAQGGNPIVGNPLLGNQTTPQAQMPMGQYAQSSAPSGPAIEQTPNFGASGDDTLSKGFSDLASGIKKNKTERDDNKIIEMDPSSWMAGGGEINERHFHEYFSDGGEVPAMVSPGEIYLSPEKVDKVLKEGVDPAKIGEKFKGKASVKGDSLKNDTIPKTLKEGGVVIDRKNVGSREKRELFVHRTMAKKKVKARG